MTTAASNKAIEVLRQGIIQIRQSADQQVSELERAIANLSNDGNAPHALPEGTTRPSAPAHRSYHGMTKPVALELYMRERRGQKIPISQVVSDLLAGGADLGEPDRHERNIMACVRGKPLVYDYDRDRQEIALAPTADEQAQKAIRRRRNRKSARLAKPVRSASA